MSARVPNVWGQGSKCMGPGFQTVREFCVQYAQQSEGWKVLQEVSGERSQLIVIQ